ncbi:MAG: HAMP domain-containing histidine kinase [Elusimicrobia bacterium]|nr:HAMP domain-containing histidine kinase [Elusimicrobiota bacterium]
MGLKQSIFWSVLAVSGACLAVLVADQVLSARRVMHDRMKTRIESIAALVSTLAVPALKARDRNGLDRSLRPLIRLPSMTYLKVWSAKGELLFHGSDSRWKPATGMRDRSEDGASGAVFERFWDLRDGGEGAVVGTAAMGISVRGVRRGLSVILARGIALGIGILLLLAWMARRLGRALARKLELLQKAVENFRSGKAPAFPDVEKTTEIGRLSREFKSLYETLQSEREKRRRLEKLRQELTAMIVHDLRQPVTVIEASLHLIGGKDYFRFPERQKLQIMLQGHRALDRLNGMISTALQMARLSDVRVLLKKRGLPIGQLLQECAAACSAAVLETGRGWDFQVPKPLSSRRVYGDGDLLKRLVGNLILNAVDHSPPGGRISLGARPSGSTGRDGVEIFVRDEGKSIPIHMRSEIFTKYRTLSESGRNMGLGLTFCKMVADKHNGRIQVRSEDGGGNTFSVVLPFFEPEQGRPAGNECAESGARF